MNHSALAILVVCACTVLPSAAHADCIGVRVVDAKRNAALVFEGTVTKTELVKHPEYETSLIVHRVWKGNVPKEITVYHIVSSEEPPLPVGERRIIFAVRQTPVMRKAAGGSEDVPLREVWLAGCSSAWPADEFVVRQLGRSHAPK